MPITPTTSLNFRSGFSLGVAAGKVIAQAGPRPHPDFPESHIMEWSEATGWSSFKLDLTAIRMFVTGDAINQMVIMGKGGYVAVISNGRSTEEMIDQSNDGPRLRGNIRDMRYIEKHLYAVGMNRQVYRRERAAEWVHCDRGVVEPLGSLNITGFSGIDGISESDIYAVGFNGEIWYYDGTKWCELNSPTNVILHRVRMIKPGLIFASGQLGVLLRGSQDEWSSIDHGATTEDLWGMEWFNGHLYVACDSAIYRLEGDELAPVKTGLGSSFTYRHLHANAGAMWSFGPKHVAKTDGKNWVDVTPTEL